LEYHQIEVENQDESGLMQAVANGDEAAFTVLFRRYEGILFRFACRMTGSPEAAEDLIQECFVRVLRSAGRFDAGRGSLRVYLYATARNLAIKAAQKRPTGQNADEDTAVELLDGSLGPEQLVLGVEASEVVKRAVGMLPTAQREALILVEYEDLSLEEAAKVLEIEIGAVKSRVHRARENLKRLLAPYFGRERMNDGSLA
jgi:RNA polymerase sigma-70 factor (ECF subfamily)